MHLCPQSSQLDTYNMKCRWPVNAIRFSFHVMVPVVCFGVQFPFIPKIKNTQRMRGREREEREKKENEREREDMKRRVSERQRKNKGRERRRERERAFCDMS